MPVRTPEALNPASIIVDADQSVFFDLQARLYDKADARDFVLWKAAKEGEPSWNCALGAGRPGWHIECSALALRELGTTIDLHGGGSDLIFPHHECERAQSEAATGVPFARHWMHVAMVYMNGHKMSKSLGNLVFVDALRREFDPRAIRLAIIEHHYRREWEWDDTLMPRNAARVQACENDLDSGYAFVWMQTNRNTATIIFHADTAVSVKSDFDIFTMTAQCFVGGIVDHFLDDMERVLSAGVHPRSLFDRFQSLEDPDR